MTTVIEAADSTTGDDQDTQSRLSKHSLGHVPAKSSVVELNIFPDEEEGELMSDEGQCFDADEIHQTRKRKHRRFASSRLGEKSENRSLSSANMHSRLGSRRACVTTEISVPAIKHRLGKTGPMDIEYIPSLESVAPRYDPTVHSTRSIGVVPKPPPFPKPKTALLERMKFPQDTRENDLQRPSGESSRYSGGTKFNGSAVNEIGLSRKQFYESHKSNRSTDFGAREARQIHSVKVVNKIDYMNDRVISISVPVNGARNDSLKSRLGRTSMTTSTGNVGGINTAKKDVSWKELSDSCDEHTVDPSTIKRKKLKKKRKDTADSGRNESKHVESRKRSFPIRSAVVLSDSTNRLSSTSKEKSPNATRPEKCKRSEKPDVVNKGKLKVTDPVNKSSEDTTACKEEVESDFILKTPITEPEPSLSATIVVKCEPVSGSEKEEVETELKLANKTIDEDKNKVDETVVPLEDQLALKSPDVKSSVPVLSENQVNSQDNESDSSSSSSSTSKSSSSSGDRSSSSSSDGSNSRRRRSSSSSSSNHSNQDLRSLPLESSSASAIASQVKIGLTCTVPRKRRQLSTVINPCASDSSDSSDNEWGEDSKARNAARIPLEPRCISSAKYKASIVNQQQLQQQQQLQKKEQSSASTTLGEEVSKKVQTKTKVDLYMLEKTKLGIAKTASRQPLHTEAAIDGMSDGNGKIDTKGHNQPVEEKSTRPAPEVLDIPKCWRKNDNSNHSKVAENKKPCGSGKDSKHAPSISNKNSGKQKVSRPIARKDASSRKTDEKTKPDEQFQPPVSARLSTVCNTYNVYKSPIATSNQLNGFSPGANTENNASVATEETKTGNLNGDVSGNKPFYQLNTANNSGMEPQQLSSNSKGTSTSATFMPHPDYDADSAAAAAVIYSTLLMDSAALVAAGAAGVHPPPQVKILPPNSQIPVSNSNSTERESVRSHMKSTPAHNIQPPPLPPMPKAMNVNPELSSQPDSTCSPYSLAPGWCPTGPQQPPLPPVFTNDSDRVLFKYLPWCYESSDAAPSISQLTPYFAQFWDSFQPTTNADAKIARQVAVGLLKSAIIFKEGRGETVELELKIMLNLMKNLQNFE